MQISIGVVRTLVATYDIPYGWPLCRLFSLLSKHYHVSALYMCKYISFFYHKNIKEMTKYIECTNCQRTS